MNGGAGGVRVMSCCPVAQKLSPTGPIPGSPTTSDPLHGSFRSSLNRAQAEEAERRAQSLFADAGLARLLSVPRAPIRQVPRARDIFVNRNLRMAGVELIGFDMDYTLAIYHMRRLEQLAYDMTLAKLVSERGYPTVIGQLQYDHHFVMRGLAVDKANGNLLKMDRFGYVGRAYHGLRPLDREVWKKLYRNQRVKLKDPRFAWIDTLFALPEAWLFAGIIELLESLGQRVDYGKLYDDIRDAIDTVHRDNSLKREVRKDLGRYVFQDPELGAGAAQAALGRQAAVPADELGVGLHGRGDALPAGRPGGGVPELAQLLRLHRDAGGQAGVLLRAAALPGAGDGGPGRGGARGGRGHAPGARQGVPGRQPGAVRAADGLRGRARAVRGRSHLRRHPQVEEVLAVAHVHGGAGDRGRDHLHGRAAGADPAAVRGGGGAGAAGRRGGAPQGPAQRAGPEAGAEGPGGRRRRSGWRRSGSA